MKIPISRTLLLAFLLVSIIPLLISGLIAQSTTKKHEENRAALRLENDISSLSTRINVYIFVAIRDSFQVAAGLKYGAKDHATSLLSASRRVNPNFSIFRLMDLNGTVIASSEPSQIGTSITVQPEELRELFAKATKATFPGYYLSDLHEAFKRTQQNPGAATTIADPTGLPYDIKKNMLPASARTEHLHVLIPLFDPKGQRIGVVQTTFTTRYALDLITAVTAITGKENVFIVDSNNYVLFSHGEQTPVGEILKPAYRSMLEKVTASKPRARKQAVRIKFLDQDFFASVVVLDEWGENKAGGWRLIGLQPHADIMEGINSGWRQATYALWTLLGFVIVSALWLSRSISRPIRLLARNAEAVAAGNYSLRVADSSTAEVSHLGNAFNLMAQAVAAKQYSLEAQIAERERTQAHLYELQSRQESILNGAGDGLLGTDASGKISFINPVGTNIIGVWAEDLVGRNLCELVSCSATSGASNRCSKCPMAINQMPGDKHVHEDFLQRPDGQRIPIEYVVSPLTDQAGKFTGAVMVFRDVTQRKEHEQELTRAREAAEIASRMKSTFLANMSHEIRTPMNGVLGFTNLLLDTSLDGEQREHVETIRNSGEALLQVINDILDFSKVEAGKMSVDKLPFDLSKAVEEVGHLLSPQAELKGVELVLKIAENVPSNIEGDPGRIRQVLLNLASNAIKFTRKGYVLIELKIIASTDANEPNLVQCSVTDTGIGIPAEKQALMFQEFSQADASTTREFGGTGLGLVISKRLIELMGGQIGFSSEAGKGSRFWFTLASPAQPLFATMPAKPLNIAAFNVLVVDDYEINRRLVSQQLKGWGIRHQCVSSGADALAAMHAAVSAGNPFNIAILDFLMPQMDGLELGVLIKSDVALRSTAMIMLTSGSRRSAAPTFLASGFCEFLMKPIARPQQFLESIIRAWHSHTEHPDVNPDLYHRAAHMPASTPPLVAHARSSGAVRIVTNQAAVRLRVLVAEDNAINQRLIKHMLEKLNCRVDFAFNGREAVSMTNKLHYDIVFMDCLMPEMDGYEATTEIRKRENGAYRVPIIALTANAMNEAREKCIAAGMDDYLSKPVYQGHVKEMLERWVVPQPNARLAN